MSLSAKMVQGGLIRVTGKCVLIDTFFYLILCLFILLPALDYFNYSTILYVRKGP